MKQPHFFEIKLIAASLFFLSALSAPAWFSSAQDKNQAAQENTLPPEYREITNQIAATQARYDGFIQQVEKTLAAARERLALLQDQEARLTNEIAAAETNIAQLRQTNEARISELEFQQNKLKQAETILAEGNARIIQLTDAIQAEKVIKAREEELTRLQQKLDNEQKNFSAKLEALITENKTLKNELAAQNKMTAEQKKTAEKLQKEVDENRKKLADAHSENRELQQLTQQLQEQNKTLQATQQNAITGVSASLREFNEFLNARTNTTAKP